MLQRGAGEKCKGRATLDQTPFKVQWCWRVIDRWSLTFLQDHGTPAQFPSRESKPGEAIHSGIKIEMRPSDALSQAGEAHKVEFARSIFKVTTFLVLPVFASAGGTFSTSCERRYSFRDRDREVLTINVLNDGGHSRQQIKSCSCLLTILSKREFGISLLPVIWRPS
jgi:hypothetical protein